MIGRVKKIGGDLLLHAINHANVHEATALIEEGEADVNYQNINGQTPLHVSQTYFNDCVVCGDDTKHDFDRTIAAVRCKSKHIGEL